MKLPEFFKDDSDSMKYEETIDFFISWTIRCADVKYEENFSLLNIYSKGILSKLIGNDDFGNVQFKDVKVWKQSGHVDLWVEFEKWPEGQKIGLVIENKMYSSIREGQLEKYRDQAIEHYKNDPKREIEYVFLRPDYEMEIKNINERKECEDLKFRYLNLEELKETLPEARTGNELFDEFWFNWFEA